MGPRKVNITCKVKLISLVFSEVAEIALVAARLGQFQCFSENTRDINP